MIAHSAGVQLEAKAQGGIMQGLKRSVLGGGSFFVTTYTAPSHGGWVDVAGRAPRRHRLHRRHPAAAVLPTARQLDRQLRRRRSRHQVGRHGQPVRRRRRVRLPGQRHWPGVGRASTAPSTSSTCEAGEVVTIDTGHVVAYALDINFKMRRAVQGRSIQSLKSGEGWVFDFTGPGRVLLQSRNPEAFAHWVGELAPGETPRGGIGGLGGLAGGILRPLGPQRLDRRPQHRPHVAEQVHAAAHDLAPVDDHGVDVGGCRREHRLFRLPRPPCGRCPGAPRPRSARAPTSSSPGVGPAQRAWCRSARRAARRR